MFTQTEIARLSTPMLAVSSSTTQLMNLKARVMTCFAKAEAAMGCAMGPQEPVILTELYQTLDYLVSSWRYEITSGLPIQS